MLPAPIKAQMKIARTTLTYLTTTHIVLEWFCVSVRKGLDYENEMSLLILSYYAQIHHTLYIVNILHLLD